MSRAAMARVAGDAGDGRAAAPLLEQHIAEHAAAPRAVGHDIDLGLDPPLDPSGAERPLVSGSTGSVRWLFGALLTAVSGAAMMGAAVFGTTDAALRPGEASVAPLQSPARPAPAAQGAGAAAPPARGDKLVRPLDIALAKRTFRVPTTVRVDGRDVLQSRAYTRVTAPLEVYASPGRALPGFNPMVLISEANARSGFSAVTVQRDPDADVSISRAPLLGVERRFSADVLDDEAALAQAALAEAPTATATIAERPIVMLDRAFASTTFTDEAPITAQIPVSPFAKLEVRLVAENFLSLPKLSEAQHAVRIEETLVVIGTDAPLRAALASAEVPEVEADLAARALEDALGGKARPGQRLKLSFENAVSNTGAARRALVRVALYDDGVVRAIAARRDAGGFTVAPLPVRAAEAAKQDRGDRLTVFASIYETALRQGVPKDLIDELVRVYSYDVDFQRPAAATDQIEFFYAEPAPGSEETGELLFASISIGGQARRYYRFQPEDSAEADFYDADGRSARRFLLRMPLPSGELRSGFGWRRHPILGYMKMHTGVDWSNRVGTPILAAGNGVVIKAGWDGGYGRRVEIEHANGYITTYSHMSGFGDGIEEGRRVRQGQVIGYLGSSGLSTGPHLHYEVIVNDNFLDPMAIRLPRGRELENETLDAFKSQRERLVDLMDRADRAMTEGAPAPSAE
jgi:murein DD-endopeptidase MepM/ murein hydrolase activator NlpD